VVGGGVAAGVAGSQDPGEGLVGVVQEPEDHSPSGTLKPPAHNTFTDLRTCANAR